jgi:hypothetical protein
MNPRPNPPHLHRPDARNLDARNLGARPGAPGGAGQRGMVAVEFALLLPLLALLLLCLVEGAGVLRSSLVLSEASREAAREVLRSGDTAKAASLAANLASALPASSLHTVVETNTQARTVTVRLEYNYAPLLGNSDLYSALRGDPLVLCARTVMPLP